MSFQGIRNRMGFLALLAALSCLLPAAVAFAGDYEPDPTAPRSEIPQEYQWDYKDILDRKSVV